MTTKTEIYFKLQNLAFLKLKMNFIHQWLMFPDLQIKDKKNSHQSCIQLSTDWLRDMKHKYKELTNAKANYSGSFIIPKPTELSDNNIPKSRKICKEGLTFTPANESSL